MGIQDRDYWRERYNEMTVDDRSPPARRRKSKSSPFMGGFVAVVLVAVLFFSFRYYLAQKTIADIQSRAQAQQLQLQRQIAAQQQHQMEVQRQLAIRQQQQHQLRLQQLQIQLEESRARSHYQQPSDISSSSARLARDLAEADHQTAMDEQRRRDAAWSGFYRKPANCDNAVGNAFVECGNHYIRERAKFENLYSAGKL